VPSSRSRAQVCRHCDSPSPTGHPLTVSAETPTAGRGECSRGAVHAGRLDSGADRAPHPASASRATPTRPTRAVRTEFERAVLIDEGVCRSRYRNGRTGNGRQGHLVEPDALVFNAVSNLVVQRPSRSLVSRRAPVSAVPIGTFDLVSNSNATRHSSPLPVSRSKRPERYAANFPATLRMQR
jgi:hypothetical protein